MAINFPFSPKIDQIYTQGNLSWQWNGIEWVDYISVIDNLNISNALSIGGRITGYNSTKIANGQVLIGNSLSGSFESATLTGHGGIDIVNDSGSITISANITAISGAANSVSNGGGITGYITGGGVLTLGSNGSSANGTSTIVTRGADGSFAANIITANNGFLDGTSRAITQVVNGGSVTGTIVGNTLTLGGGSGGGATSVVNASGINGTISSSTLTLSVIPGAFANSVVNASGLTGYITGGGALTLGASAGAFANSVTNGGGITGYITGGGTLTLGSTGSSANGASTIVTRDAAGNFTANVITASNGHFDGTLRAITQVVNGGSVTGTISGNTLTLGGGSGGGATSVVNASGINGSISGSVLTLSVSAGAFANSVTNGGGVTGYITGGGALTLGSTGASANGASTIVTRGADGSFLANIISVGGILSTGANGVSVIGNSTNYFGNIYGTAMLARYADLAESYSADQYYSPGTVVEFGGIKEITLASNETTRVAGVISTKPAYLMNMEQQGDNMLAVALQGRVPCKVTGVVHKGDMMVSAGNGLAKACSAPVVGTLIGKALENHFSSSDGVIEVVVGIR